MATKTGIKYRLDKRELDRIIRETPGKIEGFLAKVGAEIVADIVLSFGTSPPGREYRRGKRRRVHVASVANYPPNVDFGALRASINWTRISPLLIRVHDQVEYGIYLEFGTPRMKKRPFVAPVFAIWRNGKFAEAAKSAGLLQ